MTEACYDISNCSFTGNAGCEALMERSGNREDAPICGSVFGELLKHKGAEIEPVVNCQPVFNYVLIGRC